MCFLIQLMPLQYYTSKLLSGTGICAISAGIMVGASLSTIMIFRSQYHKYFLGLGFSGYGLLTFRLLAKAGFHLNKLRMWPTSLFFATLVCAFIIATIISILISYKYYYLPTKKALIKAGTTYPMTFGDHLKDGHVTFKKKADLWLIRNPEIDNEVARKAFDTNLEYNRESKNRLSTSGSGRSFLSANVENVVDKAFIKQMNAFISQIQRDAEHIKENTSIEIKKEELNTFLSKVCYDLVGLYEEKSAIAIIRKYDQKEGKILTLASSNGVSTSGTSEEKKLIQESFDSAMSTVRYSINKEARLPMPGENEEREVVIQCINSENNAPFLSFYLATHGRKAIETTDILMEFDAFNNICLAISTKYDKVHKQKGNGSDNGHTYIDYQKV